MRCMRDLRDIVCPERHCGVQASSLPSHFLAKTRVTTLRKKIFIFMYVCVCTCVVMGVYWWKPEESTRLSGAHSRCLWAAWCGCWGPEQGMSFIPAPSFQPQHEWFLHCFHRGLSPRAPSTRINMLGTETSGTLSQSETVLFKVDCPGCFLYREKADRHTNKMFLCRQMYIYHL